MTQTTHSTTKKPALRNAAGNVGTHTVAYLSTVVAVLFVTTVTAASLDLLPEERAASLAAAPVLVSAPVPTNTSELPTRIVIPSIDMEVTVANPVSTDVAVLDRELLKGAVRYPTSAKLGEDGNVIIFGHSSYLPIVRNDSFKAFNGIEDLTKGEQIIVSGAGYEYVYAVESVQSADAGEDAIPLRVDGRKLTLATCDSFGSESSRFIVTATLITTRVVGS